MWHFGKAVSLQDIENIQKRTLKFRKILTKAPLNIFKNQIEVPWQLEDLGLYVQKLTLIQLNPGCLANIFRLSSLDRAASKQQDLNLKTIRPNQVKFGKKTLRTLGPKTWNNLPPHTNMIIIFQP